MEKILSAKQFIYKNFVCKEIDNSKCYHQKQDKNIFYKTLKTYRLQNKAAQVYVITYVILQHWTLRSLSV